jgi:hypothetical protein
MLQTNYLLNSNLQKPEEKQLQTFYLIGATTVEVINTNSMIATNAKQTLPVENFIS